MSITACSTCGDRFSGRSDALYCSGACRQKAHRARTARRIAELQERVAAGSATAGIESDAARSLQNSVGDSTRRAREQVERWRELCRLAELHLKESMVSTRERRAAP